MDPVKATDARGSVQHQTRRSLPHPATRRSSRLSRPAPQCSTCKGQEEASIAWKRCCHAADWGCLLRLRCSARCQAAATRPWASTWLLLPRTGGAAPVATRRTVGWTVLQRREGVVPSPPWWAKRDPRRLGIGRTDLDRTGTGRRSLGQGQVRGQSRRPGRGGLPSAWHARWAGDAVTWVGPRIGTRTLLRKGRRDNLH